MVFGGQRILCELNMNYKNILELANSYENILKKQAQETTQPFNNGEIADALAKFNIIKKDKINEPTLNDPYFTAINSIQTKVSRLTNKLNALVNNYNSWLNAGPEATPANQAKKQQMESDIDKLEQAIDSMSGFYGVTVIASSSGAVKVKTGKPFDGQDTLVAIIKKAVSSYISGKSYTTTGTASLKLLPQLSID
jgi:hypothetical protein